MTTLIQSHNYTINLNNVCYFRPWIMQHKTYGTTFKMNNGRDVDIT